MGNILSRIQEIACKEGITIGALERGIGASKGVLSRAIANGTDIQSKWIGIIVENYPLYSTRWLLTGEGPMLRDSKASEESTMDHSPEKVQSTSSDVVTLRLMEKLDEKDTKIDQLQAELRRQSEELAAIKALHSQSQNKESDHHTKISEVIENFTSDSSGDYGEGYPLTKKPTSSKRSSAGKM